MKTMFIRKCIAAAAAAMALSFAIAPAARAEAAANGLEVREINGWRYAFNADGTPAYGWLQIGENWYFAGRGGGFLHGDHAIEGKAYTFASDGTYVCEGVHRDGFEDDIYNLAVINVMKYWNYYQLALDLLNEERASNGLAPLRLDRHLCVIATYRANHMWKHNYEDHIFPEGNIGPEEMVNMYFGRKVRSAENINRRIARDVSVILDPRTPEEIVRKSQVALLNSPHHHVLMNDPADTAVGIGMHFTPSREMFIQIFAEL